MSGPSIPAEIFLEIVCHVSRADFTILALSCKAFLPYCRAALYTHISHTRIKGAFDAIKSNKDIASVVKSIEINLDHFQQIDADFLDKFKGALLATHNLTTLNLITDCRCNQILHECRNSFQLRSFYCELFPDTNLVAFLQAQPKLESLWLSRSCPYMLSLDGLHFPNLRRFSAPMTWVKQVAAMAMVPSVVELALPALPYEPSHFYDVAQHLPQLKLLQLPVDFIRRVTLPPQLDYIEELCIDFSMLGTSRPPEDDGFVWLQNIVPKSRSDFRLTFMNYFLRSTTTEALITRVARQAPLISQFSLRYTTDLFETEIWKREGLNGAWIPQSNMQTSEFKDLHIVHRVRRVVPKKRRASTITWEFT